MINYYEIDKREEIVTNFDRFKLFLKRTFSLELFVGLGVVFREMVKRGNTHTFLYPLEKMEMSPRYRGVHKLLRVLESGNERCIGCGLCSKVCVSNCIDMDTKKDENDRKEVLNYSINFGRCVYCALCADVCPELAIVHGGEYEFASEQRASFGFKNDILTKPSELKNQQEFLGYGSIPKGAKLKLTKTAYIKVDE